jgi:drug/metabolite transporter (DMT)-like permease
MPSTHSRYLPAAALAILALIWGYNWVVMKVGLEYAPPFTFATLRNFLAAICLFAVLAVLRRPLRPPRPIGLVLLLGLFQTTGFVGLTMWALTSGAAGKTAVLTYTMPFWLLLMAWPILGERVAGLQWVSVAMAAIGLLLVLGPWRMHGLVPSLLAVAGGLSWAASAIVAKIIHKRHRADLLSLTTWQMLLGAVPLAVIALTELDQPIVWSGEFGWALAFNVVLANAVAWILWLWVLRALPAGIAGLGTLAIPVVGYVSSAAQLGERPTAIEALGMALIIAALALLSALTLRGPAPDLAAPD